MKRLSFFRFWSVLLGLIIAAMLASCAQQQRTETYDAVAPAPVPADTKVTADETNAKASEQKSSRLGTQWGEGIDSHVTTVALSRISNTPVTVTQIDYSARSRKGRAINEAVMANGRIGLSILNDRNGKWPLTQSGQQVHLRGRDGERYQLFYRNYSNRTYEIVATVDGLDVISGNAGSISNTGYVLRPGGTLLIEGFRKSDSEVAAFRFSAVEDSYTANTPAGSAKNAGVIGTAVFELNAPRARTPRQPTSSPQAFPGDSGSDRGYAPPPSYQE